jgi:hypothetical protein
MVSPEGFYRLGNFLMTSQGQWGIRPFNATLLTDSMETFAAWVFNEHRGTKTPHQRHAAGWQQARCHVMHKTGMRLILME